MPDAAPSLPICIAAGLADALERTDDYWIRAELPYDWPIPEAASQLGERYENLRLAILRPFKLEQFDALDVTKSDNPSEITNWRGEPQALRRTSQTVVLGDARGEKEAGLRSVPELVQHRDLLRQWESKLLAWAEETIHSRTPQDLFAILLELAVAGRVDANALDEYIGSATSGAEEEILERLRSGLWYLQLFPDRHVLDAGRARSRLERNFSVKGLLLAASETPADVKRLQRLESSGHESAKRALEYRATHDRSWLEGVELEDILQIIEPQGPDPGPPRPRPPIDLFDFLDLAAGESSEEIASVLASLTQDWDLEKREDTELLAAFASRDVKVVVRPNPPEGNQWTGDGSTGDQAITYMGGADADRDWLRFAGSKVTGDALLERARAQDEALGGAEFETLVSNYLRTRTGLVVYERWLRESAFELLLLNGEAREAVAEFLESWHSLVDTASRSGPAQAELLRKELTLLEAIWGAPTGAPEEFEWSALGPFHPYILEPQLAIAEATLDNLGSAELGSKVEWALDRSIPAFSVIWGFGKTFFLARRGDTVVFEAAPSSLRPTASAGDGLYQVVRAFLGFHPYAKSGFVLTLIDPPKGGAVQKNLKRIGQLVENLRVYLVTTRGDGTQLEEAGDAVRNLGRFDSLDEWVSRSGVRSHVVVYFARQPAGSAAPVPADWGPTRGAHVALKVRLRSGSLFQRGLSPSVTFEPRASNRAVMSLQRLAAPEIGNPDLFQIRPMLSDQEASQFESLTNQTDWLVVGAPSPLGLVAPRELGNELVYLGREPLGTYGLFAYSTSLFPLRKRVTEEFRDLPLLPNSEEVERRLMDLAIRSPNGLLRIGGTQGKTLWEQVGVIVASTMSQELDDA